MAPHTVRKQDVWRLQSPEIPWVTWHEMCSTYSYLLHQWRGGVGGNGEEVTFPPNSDVC
jgi:hypothetical protein